MPEIRAARVDDAEQVFELLDARSRAAFGASEMSRPRVLGEFRRSVAGRFVAEEAGGVVGYAHVRPTHDVVVVTADPATADALLACVEERARAQEIPALEATVVAADEPVPLARRARGIRPRTGRPPDVAAARRRGRPSDVACSPDRADVRRS